MGYLSDIARLGLARCGGHNAGMQSVQGEEEKAPRTTRKRPAASKNRMQVAVTSTEPARSTPSTAGAGGRRSGRHIASGAEARPTSRRRRAGDATATEGSCSDIAPSPHGVPTQRRIGGSYTALSYVGGTLDEQGNSRHASPGDVDAPNARGSGDAAWQKSTAALPGNDGPASGAAGEVHTGRGHGLWSGPPCAGRGRPIACGIGATGVTDSSVRFGRPAASWLPVGLSARLRRSFSIAASTCPARRANVAASYWRIARMNRLAVLDMLHPLGSDAATDTLGARPQASKLVALTQTTRQGTEHEKRKGIHSRPRSCAVRNLRSHARSIPIVDPDAPRRGEACGTVESGDRGRSCANAEQPSSRRSARDVRFDDARPDSDADSRSSSTAPNGCRRVTDKWRAISATASHVLGSWGVESRLDMLHPLGQGGAAVRRVAPLEVVVQGLYGLNAGVLHLPVTQLAHGAFRHTRPLCYPGKIRKSNGAQASEYGGEKCRLVHAPHFQPIFGLRQPANGPRAGA
ncbi:hypothetical protein [Achromobacter phage CF418P1]|nr:hypothetical protein [Achromobacter phage CF418P1]